MIQPSFTIILSTQCLCSCQVWKSSSSPLPRRGKCRSLLWEGNSWTLYTGSCGAGIPFTSITSFILSGGLYAGEQTAFPWPSPQPEVQYQFVPVGCASAQLFPAELFPIALRDPGRKMTQFLSYCSRIMLAGEIINRLHLLDYLCICVNLSWAYNKSERDSCCTVK